MALTFVGLWMWVIVLVTWTELSPLRYNQAKHDVAKGERKRGVAEKQTSGLLPTSNPSISFRHNVFTSPVPTPPPERALSPTQTLR
jgi:hypothetical protein